MYLRRPSFRSSPLSLFYNLAEYDINPLRRIAEEEGYQFTIEKRLASEIEKVAGRDPSIMLRFPSYERYKQIFHTLLYVEEVRMNVDIRQVLLQSRFYVLLTHFKYDLPRQMAFRDKSRGNLYRLLVPKLAEKRPSVLRGDYVHLRQSFNRNCLHKGPSLPSPSFACEYSQIHRVRSLRELGRYSSKFSPKFR